MICFVELLDVSALGGLLSTRPPTPATTTTTTTTTTTRRPTRTTKAPTTRPTCQQTATVFNGKNSCAGDLIFEDNFNGISTPKWKNEIKFANDPVIKLHYKEKRCYGTNSSFIFRITSLYFMAITKKIFMWKIINCILNLL